MALMKMKKNILIMTMASYAPSTSTNYVADKAESRA